MKSKLTFEERFEMLMEALDKSREESDKSREESDKRKVESDKELAEIKRLIKANAQEIGGIGRSNGQVAEDTIYNALEKDMSFAGLNFHAIDRNWNRKETALKLQAEFDIVLINDDTLALIETKYKVRDKDVTKLIDTTKNNFRTLFPQYSGYKIVLGVGGMAFEQRAIDEANANGVGLIKIIGDKVEFQTEGIKVY